MSNAWQNAANAYQAAASRRGLREQEADVFRRANAALKVARVGSVVDQSRALADNRRLWLTVHQVLVDPENALPEPLRASMIAVGRTVRREMDKPVPDYGFLIEVNENIAAGLSSSA
jgi:flagellar biosynthesis activator protein FlaF